MKPYLLLATLAIFTHCNNSKTSEEKKTGDTTVTQTDTLSKQTINDPGKPDIESFGTIKLGQYTDQIIETLGKPGSKTKPIEWEADGLMHEDWLYPDKGLSLNFTKQIDSADKTKVLSSILAKAPCDFKTKKNVGIGSGYEEVTAAYGNDINKEESNPEQIVVGNIYGGIIFTFKNGKAETVFLGAAAE